MKYRFFTVPIHCREQAENELNAFLAAHRIVSVEKKCIEDGINSFWMFCVEWLEHDGPMTTNNQKKIRVDYRELLNEADFAIYAKLRDLRKELSKEAGVPPYVVFTNEQLADIVRGRLTTKTALQKIKGVGDSRIEKYATPFVTLMRELCHDDEKKTN